jgi:hypothetical protein
MDWVRAGAGFVHASIEQQDFSGAASPLQQSDGGMMGFSWQQLFAQAKAIVVSLSRGTS